MKKLVILLYIFAYGLPAAIFGTFVSLVAQKELSWDQGKIFIIVALAAIACLALAKFIEKKKNIKV